jgi:hypothetical protein
MAGTRKRQSAATAAFCRRSFAILLFAALNISVPQSSRADEGGVSFWIPGFFGSLAATPQQPGWTFATINYNTNVSAGGDVALAREFERGDVPLTFKGTVSASIHADVDMQMFIPTYVFSTPFLGGQAAVSLLGLYGRNDTTLAGTFNGSFTVGPPPIPPITKLLNLNRNIDSTLWGFGDLLPMASVRWNNGTDNWMVYLTGDIPVGAYSSTRLANLGLGHGAIDGGVGYTYFDQKTGHEFSAVLGFTGNFENTSTNYTNGVDMHLDWGASQFLTKQTQVGLVGYVYKEIGCDSGSGDRVGCFQSQVFGIGPQIGYIFQIDKEHQGYINLKGYGEFDGLRRPDGWNVWLTLVISPAAKTPPPATTRMITK